MAESGICQAEEDENHILGKEQKKCWQKVDKNREKDWKICKKSCLKKIWKFLKIGA